MQQTWVQQMVNIGADGNALASSNSQTSLLTGSASAGVWTLPANQLGLYTGIWIRASGKMSTLVTSPGTLTFTVKVGSVNAAVSPAFALNTTAQTNATFIVDLMLLARTIGSSTSAALLPIGTFTSRAVVGSAAAGSGGAGVLCWPDTAPAVGTGFDSTTAQAIDFQAQWSISSASNSITLQQYSLALLN